MIDVALLGIIRRWHLRDQVPLREIARRLGISRNTVRRYLRSETTEPSYAERRSSSLLDKYSVQLSAWLKAEASKPRKQRRNLKQLHLDLKELGYEGSYDRVAAFARQWKVGQLEWVNSASKRTNPPKPASTTLFASITKRLNVARSDPSRLGMEESAGTLKRCCKARSSSKTCSICDSCIRPLG
ncbi:Homeodomain-like domain-containing protein [Duganella sacchari]|uniref:Homeodomain-like domain-containing protein n=1 Tax=Duganella sacchari TaxID=551987 RepID=A0A1M7RA95_9BURK|nr:Homeodomain-like domain-containing protein [Duganella sacchari]